MTMARVFSSHTLEAVDATPLTPAPGVQKVNDRLPDLAKRYNYHMSETRTYTLMHMDTPLLKFAANPSVASTSYEILWVNENRRKLMPFGLEANPKGIEGWIKRRNIPKNRAFANTFLARNGLSENRALGIISLSKGLSLDDCYWIIQADDNSTFEQVNLYDNPISRLLAQVAFTGAGTPSRASFHSSPEFTTGGRNDLKKFFIEF